MKFNEMMSDWMFQEKRNMVIDTSIVMEWEILQYLLTESKTFSYYIPILVFAEIEHLLLNNSKEKKVKKVKGFLEKMEIQKKITKTVNQQSPSAYSPLFSNYDDMVDFHIIVNAGELHGLLITKDRLQYEMATACHVACCLLEKNRNEFKDIGFYDIVKDIGQMKEWIALNDCDVNTFFKELMECKNYRPKVKKVWEESIVETEVDKEGIQILVFQPDGYTDKTVKKHTVYSKVRCLYPYNIIETGNNIVVVHTPIHYLRMYLQIFSVNEENALTEVYHTWQPKVPLTLEDIGHLLSRIEDISTLRNPA